MPPESRQESAPLPNLFYARFYWSLVAFCVCGLFYTKYLPLHDLPNHLSRYYLLTRDADLASTKDLYSVHFGLTPNLGVDIISTVLGRFIDPALVVHGLLLIALGAWSLGIYRLSVRRNDGRCSPVIFFAPLMFFNVSVLMGYLNFAFAASFIPLIYYYAEMIEAPKNRMFFLFITVLLTYFGHMMVSLIILALMFYKGFVERKTPVGKATLTVSTVLTLLVGVLFKIGSVASETKQWRFTTPLNKLWLIRSAFEVGPKLYLCTSILFGVLALLFVFRVVKLRRDDIPVILFFLVLFLICPYGLELVMNLDGRIVPIGLAFLFALTVWKQSSSKAMEMARVGVLFAIGLGLLIPIDNHLTAGNREAIQVEKMVNAIPAGSLVVTVDLNLEASFDRTTWNPGLRMVSYFAMTQKPLIMPGIYMFPTQQPIVVKPGNPILDFVASESEGRSDAEQLDKSLDRIEVDYKQSRSFRGQPIYLLLINHKRTGFPDSRRIKVMDKDNCVALALVNSADISRF